MFNDDDLPSSPAAKLPGPGAAGGWSGDPALRIRSQAQEIIDSTLQSPVGAGFDARERLFRRLRQSQHPERVEEVLLEHLKEMVELNNPDFGGLRGFGAD